MVRLARSNYTVRHGTCSTPFVPLAVPFAPQTTGARSVLVSRTVATWTASLSLLHVLRIYTALLSSAARKNTQLLSSFRLQATTAYLPRYSFRARFFYPCVRHQSPIHAIPSRGHQQFSFISLPIFISAVRRCTFGVRRERQPGIFRPIIESMFIVLTTWKV